MSRAENEKVRLRHSLDRLAGMVQSVRMNVELPGQRTQAAESLMTGASEVAMQLAKLEAYERTAEDQQRSETAPPKDAK